MLVQTAAAQELNRGSDHQLHASRLCTAHNRGRTYNWHASQAECREDHAVTSCRLNRKNHKLVEVHNPSLLPRMKHRPKRIRKLPSAIQRGHGSSKQHSRALLSLCVGEKDGARTDKQCVRKRPRHFKSQQAEFLCG